MAETPLTANTELQLGRNANAIAGSLHRRGTCHPIRVGKFCPDVRTVLRQKPASRSSTKRRRTRFAPSEVAKAEAVRDRVLLAKRTQFPPAKSTPAACVQYRMLLSSSSTTTVMDPVYASGSAKAGAMRTRGDFFAKRTQSLCGK